VRINSQTASANARLVRPKHKGGCGRTRAPRHEVQGLARRQEALELGSRRAAGRDRPL